MSVVGKGHLLIKGGKLYCFKVEEYKAMGSISKPQDCLGATIGYIDLE
jgi:hypothetical protein